MPANALHLIAAALALVLLTVLVGLRLLYTRVREMRRKRIHAQAVATSVQMAGRHEDVQAADNFRNLFEVPVLFYALVAIALATRVAPPWLVAGAWAFVALRALHSLIHCTYNRVMHRLAAFLAGFALLAGLWVAFFLHVQAASGSPWRWTPT
jgi:hypothetical protein